MVILLELTPLLVKMEWVIMKELLRNLFIVTLTWNPVFWEWCSTKHHNKNLQLLPDHCIWHKGYLTFSSSTTLIIVPNWTNVVWIYLCVCTWLCLSFFTKCYLGAIEKIFQARKWLHVYKKVNLKEFFLKKFCVKWLLAILVTYFDKKSVENCLGNIWKIGQVFLFEISF